MDASEVLCEGPLEQRSFVIFWSPRWCVMNKREFLIYTDEEASLLAPEKPLERYNVLKMSMAPELHAQSVLVVADLAGEPFAFLRTGPGQRREELVSSALWLAAFAAAARSAAGTQVPTQQRW